MTELILGIDGGASKTVALLGDASGAVLGRGAAGGSNLRAIGLDAAGAQILAAVRAAFAAAGLALSPARAACLGVAGAGREAERAALERWAAPLAGRLTVTDDASIVLLGGLSGGVGVALIAGTGSFAVGRAADGRRARAGGWGAVLGDEGGGRAIGLAALRAACRAADRRGPATALLPAILSSWRLARPEDLIARVYGDPAPHALPATLPPLVALAADAGDAVASAILADAGDELALAAATVAQALGIGPALPLALAGGVLLNVVRVRDAALAELGRRGLAPAAQLVAEPAQAALRLARSAGRQTDTSMW